MIGDVENLAAGEELNKTNSTGKWYVEIHPSLDLLYYLDFTKTIASTSFFPGYNLRTLMETKAKNQESRERVQQCCGLIVSYNIQ